MDVSSIPMNSHGSRFCIQCLTGLPVPIDNHYIVAALYQHFRYFLSDKVCTCNNNKHTTSSQLNATLSVRIRGERAEFLIALQASRICM